MDKQAIIKALRDGVQATSNGVANAVVGEPVDILASGLRYAGVPVGDKPMLGTQFLKSYGITPQVEEGLPNAIGTGLGMAAGNAMFTPKMLSDAVKRAIK
jgi:hypothetical protein